MKITKKLVSLLLLATLSISVVGCDKDKEEKKKIQNSKVTQNIITA